MNAPNNDYKPSGLIDWFAHNHVAANILMMLFIAAGLIALNAIRTETFPSIDPRTITITVTYPGATPYEIADSITNRVEEVLIGTNGVKRISSTAAEGFGVVTVEMEDFADGDEVYNDVETEVNSLSDFPPEEAERPIITRVKVTPNVMTLAIHGQVEEPILKFWAESLEENIRGLPGVALTTLRGLRDEEISIEVSEENLRQYGLSLNDVANAVNQFSQDIPAGTVESRQGDILLRVQERRYYSDQFDQVVLRSLPDGSQLTLGQIATVIDGFEDNNLISRFNGEPAAFIDILRNDSDDTLSVANAVTGYLDNLELPRGLSVSLQDDRTVALKDRIRLMVQNSILGFMLVFIILTLFLDLKLAFWTSAAIPISFLGGLMCVYFLGYSLNMISLFALIVVLGVVVDDAIITGESIFAAQAENPGDPQAVLKGVKAVIAPVTVGILTSVAAFAPLSFSTGTLGQIISVIPAVVISILLISLAEAYFILPAHLSKPTRWSRGIMASLRDAVARGLEHVTVYYLVPIARRVMAWRYVAVFAFVSLFIVTVAMVTSGTIRFVFFPQIEGDVITVNVTLPEGTSFAITADTMDQIERAAQEVIASVQQEGESIVEGITVTVGQVSSRGGGPRATSRSVGSNIGQLMMRLAPSDFRSQSSSQIEKQIRAKTENLPNIEKLEFKSSLIGEEADIDIEITHKQEAKLLEAAEYLKQQMQQIPGTKEVQDNFDEGKTEYLFTLNAQGLAAGITPLELGRQLRSAYFGQEVQRIQRGRSEVIVYVRYPKKEREELASLSQHRIRLPNGAEVPLSTIADITPQIGFASINSVNGRRIVSVTADADLTIATPTEIMEQLQEEVLPALQQRYPNLSYSFEGESRDQQEDLASLGENMLIALLLIYVMLGSQLRSYIQPVVIMSAIPFGVVGAIWGHFLLGYDLTFISLFGIVALSGVVVNDSVVLVDYLNQQHRNGTPIYESAIQAISKRFRPILLTTLTTSLGLLPILLETSLQAQFLIPMIVSLATGILFATLIIMLLVPCLVLIVEDIKALGQRFMSDW